MKKILAFYIFSLPLINSNAQNKYAPDTAMSRFFQLEQLTGLKYMDAGHLNEGMYFFEEWTPGNLVLGSGAKIDNLTFHYNGFQDQLVWLKEKTVQVILDKNNVSEFTLNNAGISYHFKKYKVPNGKDSIATFCQELYNGKVKLLVIRKNKLDTEVVRYYKMYYIYVPRPVYCIFTDGKVHVLRNARLNALYKAFPAKKDILRQKVREQHLKVKNEMDMVKAINVLEDLL